MDSTGPEYNGLSPALVNVKPQEARAVEVGTKWELFDRRLLATAALFQTDVDNARTNASTAMVNDLIHRASFDGEYRVRGIELGAAGNITRDWSVFGGLVLLDTEVLESAHRAGHRATVGQHSADAVLAAVALPVDRPIGGRWHGDLRRRGLRRPPGRQRRRTTIPCDWWRFDAFAEYEMSKNWEIEVIGLNLTDELYYDAIYQAAGHCTTDNGTFAFVAPGRAGYLTVKWKYD